MDTEEKKIKIQKRTPTERQLESLEKARLSKQKKKIIKEHQTLESSSFLSPPPYMTGLILLGCAGLVGYSFMREQKSSPITEQNSQPIQQLVAAISTLTKPVEPVEEIQLETTTPSKTRDFFSGSMKI
jgi:hypothetical protein